MIGASSDSQPCASHRPHRRNVTVDPPTFIRISMSEPFAHDGQRIPASQWSQYVPVRVSARPAENLSVLANYLTTSAMADSRLKPMWRSIDRTMSPVFTAW